MERLVNLLGSIHTVEQQCTAIIKNPKFDFSKLDESRQDEVYKLLEMACNIMKDGVKEPLTSCIGN